MSANEMVSPGKFSAASISGISPYCPRNRRQRATISGLRGRPCLFHFELGSRPQDYLRLAVVELHRAIDIYGFAFERTGVWKRTRIL